MVAGRGRDGQRVVARNRGIREAAINPFFLFLFVTVRSSQQLQLQPTPKELESNQPCTYCTVLDYVGAEVFLTIQPDRTRTTRDWLDLT